MEEKQITDSFNHNLTMQNRKNLTISGIKKIENFDDEEFLLNTVMGYLLIKGEGLELIKLDTMQGNVIIKGHIKSFGYVDETEKSAKNEKLFNRLFKWV